MSTAVKQRPMLTIRETAERLNVSEKTIRRLVANRQLAAVRVGSQLRIDADQLDAGTGMLRRSFWASGTRRGPRDTGPLGTRGPRRRR